MAIDGTVVVQTIVRAGGVVPSYVAASGGGDTFTPGLRTFFQVKNGSGGAITVTFDTTGVFLGDITIADVVVSVPATTGDKMIGPFPPEFFAHPSDGMVHVTYSGVTSLTVSALTLSTVA